MMIIVIINIEMIAFEMISLLLFGGRFPAVASKGFAGWRHHRYPLCLRLDMVDGHSSHSATLFEA
jgi:hypothetical protein